jgi:hypothetical protein
MGGAARFVQPAGIAVDGDGTLFVTDVGAHTIRRISPGGTVSTFSGWPGSFGSAEGIGMEARYWEPWDVAVDMEGTLFVSDTKNHRIRRVTSDGMSSRIAGSSFGHVDGAGISARFRSPRGIALGPNGEIYVADTDNVVIRKISSGGQVRTIAGMPGLAGSADGGPGVARFRLPVGLTIDAVGTLYIGDTGNHTIRVGSISSLSAPPLNAVSAGNEIKITWPLWGFGLKLESAASLGVEASWSDVTRERIPSGDYLSVTADIEFSSQFFRLVRP